MYCNPHTVLYWYRADLTVNKVPPKNVSLKNKKELDQAKGIMLVITSSLSLEISS